ncbi:hypothetical protein COW36_11460 [bacterium (Candidatus Blackallbacteria) CG17_big_fil_post_rev_8_21_14_2_50_48_46]|uniref:Uncharacterized protein n=1 Tax=bacterium (Candidatus Blackallbacteria) CG17_big_fil_post_rev_8_21_14_2_50_48_46 TaxID=2014261 RepID=A0A2M7G4C3_9BACT|nr:MAG: hypothetical protein COW64_21680 [bacterium (Candidatus Blackallbacteria) CG18_big_fil_WC_8_21_14_2_50_49_26]PIW16755.1 MAG: hypothetical protein COW36_11460 [bacterium (Candidatus Blackallbacteria) CG17_big_fil_post_rev_8_21_14_2_50_48_46]PIW49547.1 MAG: hypothetical protein COW20_05380 [bacterium (Candidatus Blackallbacteria) CG13_big_fil_rev_8_21_14_2_50_49_14]
MSIRMRIFRQSQKGFTILELLMALVIFIMVTAGIQLFVISAMTSMSRQTKAEIAEDLGEMVSTQVARSSTNFQVLDDIVGLNRAAYTAAPLALTLYSNANPNVNPLNPNSNTTVSGLFGTQGLSNIDAQAKKLPWVEIKLFAKPMPAEQEIPFTNPTQYITVPSLTQIEVSTEVSWKNPASTKVRTRTFTRVLSKDFSSYP